MTQINDNNANNSDDSALFDRLVDGELSATERQQLLASLDDRAVWGNNHSCDSGWRQCALAFLEAQAWGHQFKQMVAEPLSERPEAVTPPQPLFSRVRTGHWLAIAAGLLLAFSLGRLTHAPSRTHEQNTDIAVMERQEVPLPDELPAAPLNDVGSSDTVTLLVRDTSGKNQRLQVPLMEVDDFDENFTEQFGAALPAKLRNSFRDRGFDVQRRRRFAPMFFEQNEHLVPMVVPVDDTYLVPVSRPVY